jgi:hypothetical protein
MPQRRIYTLLIILGIGALIASPILAVIEYNLFGGSLMTAENNFTTPIPSWIVAIFLLSILAVLVGIAGKLLLRRKGEA